MNKKSLVVLDIISKYLEQIALETLSKIQDIENPVRSEKMFINREKLEIPIK